MYFIVKYFYFSVKHVGKCLHASNIYVIIQNDTQNKSNFIAISVVKDLPENAIYSGILRRTLMKVNYNFF